jgi:hypothetical protein
MLPEPVELWQGIWLDTNTVSDLVRHSRGRAAERVPEVGDAADACANLPLATSKENVHVRLS